MAFTRKFFFLFVARPTLTNLMLPGPFPHLFIFLLFFSLTSHTQNIVEASRTTLFNLHSRLGLNFGILFAWVAVNSILFPLCCYLMRWKTQREKQKAEQGAKKDE